MATDSVAPHPGFIAAITLLLIVPIAVIIIVIIRGFDLGPNHTSGLRGILRRSCLSVTDSSDSSLSSNPPDVEQNRIGTSGLDFTAPDHFLEQSEEERPPAPPSPVLVRDGESTYATARPTAT